MQMPSRANREFDWTTRADSGDLVVRSACRQPHLADTLYRRSSTVTDLAPVGEGIGTVRDHSKVGLARDPVKRQLRGRLLRNPKGNGG
jgi:hypothetical protein